MRKFLRVIVLALVGVNLMVSPAFAQGDSICAISTTVLEVESIGHGEHVASKTACESKACGDEDYQGENHTDSHTSCPEHAISGGCSTMVALAADDISSSPAGIAESETFFLTESLHSDSILQGLFRPPRI